MEADTQIRSHTKVQSMPTTSAARKLDVTAFPDSEEGDRRLELAMIELGRSIELPDRFDELQDHKLRWRHGAPVDDEALSWFVQALRRESREHHDPALVEVARRLEPLDRFKLGRRLEDLARSGADWAFFSMASLGSPTQLSMLSRDVARDDLHHDASAADAIVVLERNGSDEAVRGLDRIRRKGSSVRADRALAAIVRVAEGRGQSPTDLLEDTLNPFGFDANGRRMLDYGTRKVEVRLTLSKRKGPQVVVVDGRGKTRTRLPAVTKSDDREVAETTKRAFKEDRKAITRTLDRLYHSLELSMIHRRTWPAAAWRKRYSTHPLLRVVAPMLVFEFVDKSGLGVRFTMSENGDMTDIDGDAVPVGGRGNGVRVAHPVFMSDKEKKKWAKNLPIATKLQPFLQLDRPTHHPSDHPPMWRDMVESLKSPRTHQLRQRLKDRGFARGAAKAGGYSDATRSYGNWTVRLHHEPYARQGRHESKRLAITSLEVESDRGPVAAHALPIEIFSEILSDVYTIGGMH